METTQLKEKVQKHVDSLFLTLSQNLDVQVSEDVQNCFTNWLSQEAFDVLLAQKKKGLIDATTQMFTELQNDLGMTFSEQTKSDLLNVLLAEAGVSFEDNPTEIKPKDASSDKPEIHSVEKSEAESNISSDQESLGTNAHAESKQNDGAENVAVGKDPKVPKTKSSKLQKKTSRKVLKSTSQKSQKPDLQKTQEAESKEDIQELEAETNVSQVTDEAVQEANKAATNKNSGKPWTEECHDPEIIRKVNGVIALYYGKDCDKEEYSRDMDAGNIYSFNRVCQRIVCHKIENVFGIKLGKSVYSFWETFGDIYDSVLYCLQQESDEQQASDLEKKESLQELKIAKPKAHNIPVEQTKGDAAVLGCKIDAQGANETNKPWEDYHVEQYDLSGKFSKVIDKTNEILMYKLGADMSEIKREALLKNDLGADSLDIVELATEFEKAFKISIPEDATVQIQTVGDVYDCLYYYLK